MAPDIGGHLHFRPAGRPTGPPVTGAVGMRSIPRVALGASSPTGPTENGHARGLSPRLLQDEGEDVAVNQSVNVDESPRTCSSGAKVLARSTNHNIRVAVPDCGYFTELELAAA